MQFCKVHWEQLRTAIKERGLDHLVSKSGEEAVQRMVEEIEGVESNNNFDPLIAAHNMILDRALQMGGLYLFSGDYCPICEVMKHMDGKPGDITGRLWSAKEIEFDWINGPANAVLEHCRQIKIAPQVQ